MDKNFCPFINGTCRNDCKFYYPAALATGIITDHCIIAAQLCTINEMQSDELSDIYKAIKGEN